MATPEQLRAAFVANHEDFERLLLSLRVNDAGEARVAALLLTSIVEMHGAVALLAHSKWATHAPMFTRSMLEALATLRRLCADPTYLDQIHFDNANASMKVVDEFRRDPELAADEASVAQMQSVADRFEAQRDELRARGLRPESIEARFAAAGIKQMYAGYRAFCTFTHNNLTTLEARHIGEVRLVYGRPPQDPQVWNMFLGATTAVCAQAVEQAPFFTTLSTEEVAGVLEMINARWAAALAS